MGGILCDAFPQQNKISCQEKKRVIREQACGIRRGAEWRGKKGAGRGGRFFFRKKSGRRDPCWELRDSLMWRRFMPGEQEKIYAGLDSRRNINAIRYLLFCVHFFRNCVNAVTRGNDSGDETAAGKRYKSRANAWTRYGRDTFERDGEKPKWKRLATLHGMERERTKMTARRE